MVLFLTAFIFAAGLTASAEPLPSRVVPQALIILPDTQGLNFDLYDVRAELTQAAIHNEVQPHSIFQIKRHAALTRIKRSMVSGKSPAICQVHDWVLSISGKGFRPGRSQRQVKHAD